MAYRLRQHQATEPRQGDSIFFFEFLRFCLLSSLVGLLLYLRSDTHIGWSNDSERILVGIGRSVRCHFLLLFFSISMYMRQWRLSKSPISNFHPAYVPSYSTLQLEFLGYAYVIFTSRHKLRQIVPLANPHLFFSQGNRHPAIIP